MAKFLFSLSNYKVISIIEARRKKGGDIRS
jgi:hypothetical protein